MKNLLLITIITIITSCTGGGGGSSDSSGAPTPTPTQNSTEELLVLVTDKGASLNVDLLDSNDHYISQASIVTITDDSKLYLIGNYSIGYSDNGEMKIYSLNGKNTILANSLPTEDAVGTLTTGDLKYKISSKTKDIYYVECSDSVNALTDLCSVHFDKNDNLAYIKAENTMQNSTLVYISVDMFCHTVSGSSECVKVEDTQTSPSNNHQGLTYMKTGKHALDVNYTIQNNYKFDGVNKLYMSQTHATFGEELYYLDLDSDSVNFGSMHNSLIETIDGVNGSDFDQIVYADEDYILYNGETDVDGTNKLRSFQIRDGLITEYSQNLTTISVNSSFGGCIYGTAYVHGTYGFEPVKFNSTNSNVTISNNTAGATSSTMYAASNTVDNQNQIARVLSTDGVFSVEVDNLDCGSSWNAITGDWDDESSIRFLGTVSEKLYMTSTVNGKNKTLSYLSFDSRDSVQIGYENVKSIQVVTVNK